MMRALLLLGWTLWVAGMAWAQTSVSPVEVKDRAENRVGHRYWVRPGANDTSVDFYAERELRTRYPIYDKQRFRVTDIESIRTSAGVQIVYLVRFDDSAEAYIDVKEFDARLYRELAPNQVMAAPPDSPVGAAPHLWIFQRSSLFATDPDIIWERIKNEGPRAFKPVKPPKQVPRSKPPRDREQRAQ